MSAQKVALFMPDARGGGAERMMINLAQGFSDAGFDVDLVLATAEGPYLAEVAPGVAVVDLRARSVLRSLPALVAYLRRSKPEVLLSTLDYANIVAVWAKLLARVPTRVYVRVAGMISFEQRRSLKSKAILHLVRSVYPLASGVVAVSKGVEADVRTLTGAARIQTIYNPVVTPDIALRAKETPDHPWVGGAIPLVLAVGRLTSVKDYPTLLRAIALVKRVRPVRLLVLGEGPERERLERHRQELGLDADVAFPGFAINPFAYMARADVLALSSRSEGLPGVLAQALACGCPVVSTDCPSGPAEILGGGRWGKLVAVGDADGLAEAILATLETPPERSALSARAQAFSLTASVEAYRRYMQLS